MLELKELAIDSITELQNTYIQISVAMEVLSEQLIGISAGFDKLTEILEKAQQETQKLRN